MRVSCLFSVLALACATSASAQILGSKARNEEYADPKPKDLTAEQWRQQQWDLRAATDPSDLKARKNIVTSGSTPFWSRYSVWADATMPWRAAEFGAGKLSHEAAQRPGMDDRAAASMLPEANYPGKTQDDAIRAAVYRYFFGYRARGFAQKSTVYFLGLGPHLVDAPPSLIAALQNDPVLKKDGIMLRPVSKSFEVTDEAIRDRDTGAYGPVFRVDDIGLVRDGTVDVTATFSERDGHWFTRDLTLKLDKSGAWQVVRDADYALN
jgi:hypothetical protein